MRARLDSRPIAAPARGDGRMARRLLHVFSSFSIGGMQRQFALVAGALGPRYEHVVLSLDGASGARVLVRPGTICETIELPVASAAGFPGRLREIRACLGRTAPDLLVTYNWGAVEWCLVNRLFGIVPGIHCEHGFGAEEARRPLRRRNLFRRLALGRGVPLVVPSSTLRRIAVESWGVCASQVRVVPNGVDVVDMDRRARASASPVTRRDDEILVGCVAPLRPEKNLVRLLRAFAAVAAADPRWRLVIAGDGPEHGRLEVIAQQLGIRHRVQILGWIDDPAPLLREIDIAALSSDTEQLPFSLLEAAALARPIVATDVGDVRDICAAGNLRFIVERDDGEAFAAALRGLGEDRDLARMLGRANRARIAAHFTAAAMADGFEAVLRRSLEGAAPPEGAAADPPVRAA